MQASRTIDWKRRTSAHYPRGQNQICISQSMVAVQVSYEKRLGPIDREIGGPQTPHYAWSRIEQKDPAVDNDRGRWTRCSRIRIWRSRPQEDHSSSRGSQISGGRVHALDQSRPTKPQRQENCQCSLHAITSSSRFCSEIAKRLNETTRSAWEASLGRLRLVAAFPPDGYYVRALAAFGFLAPPRLKYLRPEALPQVFPEDQSK